MFYISDSHRNIHSLRPLNMVYPITTSSSLKLSREPVRLEIILRSPITLIPIQRDVHLTITHKCRSNAKTISRTVIGVHYIFPPKSPCFPNPSSTFSYHPGSTPNVESRKPFVSYRSNLYRYVIKYAQENSIWLYPKSLLRRAALIYIPYSVRLGNERRAIRQPWSFISFT